VRDETTMVTPDTLVVDLVELSVGSDLPITVIDARERLLGVIPRVTLLAALGNVTTTTGEIAAIKPPPVTVSEMTETLLDPTLEGADL
jgi:glycine betaine/proline transport system ATP-binding protein